MHNKKNPAIVRRRGSRTNNCWSKTKAAKIKPFLIHCFGRMAIKSCLIMGRMITGTISLSKSKLEEIVNLK